MKNHVRHNSPQLDLTSPSACPEHAEGQKPGEVIVPHYAIVRHFRYINATFLTTKTLIINHLTKNKTTQKNRDIFIPIPLIYLSVTLLITIMALENWEIQAKEHQKAYKYLLEKSNKTRSVQNKLLDALPELHEEAFSKINCLDCARCCKNHSPRFKQPDIKRIAKSLQLKEGDLVAGYLKLDEDGDYITKTTPCPFLAEDNSCNIYEDRPSDCRRYPYTDEDVLLKRVQLTLKNATVCPATHAVLEKLLQLNA